MRSFPFALAAMVLASAAVAVPANAQAPQASLELAGVANATATPDGAVTVTIPWAYTPPSAAASSVTSVDVTWTVTCGEVGSGLGSDSRQGAPGAMRVEGTATVSLQLVGALAEVSYPCGLAGHATNPVPGGDADSVPGLVTVVLPVVFDVTLDVEAPTRKAAPQKAIDYRATVANNGNGDVIVRFELVSGPGGGKWAALAPERVRLEPGTSLTIPVIVSTTFHNGFVSDKQDYVLRAWPVSAVDDEREGDAVEVALQANAEGFYIPGPSPVLLLGLLGLAVVVRRRA